MHFSSASSGDMMVRTRFAPSPTGSIHIGGMRTAIYNYLFAKASGGKFILRIEDTDAKRSKKQYEAEILKALKWLGCFPDEDFEKGGPYGPYRQSERKEIYRHYFEKLRKSDAVLYPCFCNAEELLKMKEEQQKQGKRIGYDGRCYFREKSEVERFLAEGRPHSYRLRLPHKSINFKDLIKGEVKIDLSSLSDPVILKSDGGFTYHFCVVVDDIEMKISHVIRGEDHLINTAYHLLIYSYLDENPPQYAHVALMVDPYGKKISKRTGGSTFLEMKEAGVLPEAVVSYLLSTGLGQEEIFKSMEEAIKAFNIEFLPKGKTHFDAGKLYSFNAKLIQSLSEEELLQRAQEGNYCQPYDLLERERLLEWLKAWKENIESLKDAGRVIQIFLCKQLDYELTDLKIITQEIREALEEVIDSIENQAGAVELLDKLVEVASSKNISKGSIMKVLRLAVTGQLKGPPLPTLLKILGTKKSIERIKNYLNASKKAR
ncbi:MAG: glutamate--tRNA ligase [Actinobacteria bacterium]|nr:glutamate--tRNA ligase [Actinomycetota bacterium]